MKKKDWCIYIRRNRQLKTSNNNDWKEVLYFSALVEENKLNHILSINFNPFFKVLIDTPLIFVLYNYYQISKLEKKNIIKGCGK